MSFAVNNPKELGTLFDGSGADERQEKLDSGEMIPVDPEQYEKWW